MPVSDSKFQKTTNDTEDYSENCFQRKKKRGVAIKPTTQQL